MPFEYRNSKGDASHLHSRLVRPRKGREQPIYYFARDRRDGEALPRVPAGYEVGEAASGLRAQADGALARRRAAGVLQFAAPARAARRRRAPGRGRWRDPGPAREEGSMGLFEEHPWLLVPIIVLTTETWQVVKALLRGVLQRRRAARG